MQQFAACQTVIVLMACAGMARADEAAVGPAVANVSAAFEGAAAEGRVLRFAKGTFLLPPGGHLQGVQMRFDAARSRHIAFLSHDSHSVAYLVVVEFPADLSREGRVIHVHTFPSDGASPPLRHAGGIQLAGDILAVGLEDNQLKTRSEVQFWNVAVPDMPTPLVHLTVRRAGPPKDKTAGAVALLGRAKDHLLAVANWDSRAIDFYKSNGKPLDDADCRFETLVHWQDNAADKSGWRPDPRFAAYQAINFVAQPDGKPFLLGFATDAAGQDIVDLFSFDADQSSDKLLDKVAGKTLILKAENHFRAAGGAWVQNGLLNFLSSPHDLGVQTIVNVIPGRQP